MFKTIKVSLAFANAVDGELSRFAGGVIAGLNTLLHVFKQLPVDTAALLALKGTFDQSMIDMVDAGKSATAVKNAAREALIAALRKDALYVEIVSDNNLALLLETGYEAASTNRTQTPLQQVEVITVENRSTGELKARVKPQRNVKAYEGRIKAAGSEFGPSISFANSREIIFKGLTAGVNYTLQICAIGGSTGKSDWSNPVTKMPV